MRSGSKKPFPLSNSRCAGGGGGVWRSIDEVMDGWQGMGTVRWVDRGRVGVE